MKKEWRSYIVAIVFLIAWCVLLFSLLTIVTNMLMAYFHGHIPILIRYGLLFIFCMLLAVIGGLIIGKPYRALRSKIRQNEST